MDIVISFLFGVIVGILLIILLHVYKHHPELWKQGGR